MSKDWELSHDDTPADWVQARAADGDPCNCPEASTTHWHGSSPYPPGERGPYSWAPVLRPKEPYQFPVGPAFQAELRYNCTRCPGGSTPLVSDADHHNAGHDKMDKAHRRKVLVEAAEMAKGLLIEIEAGRATEAKKALQEAGQAKAAADEARPPDKGSYEANYREFERTGDHDWLDAAKKYVQHPGELVQADIDAMMDKRDKPPAPVRARHGMSTPTYAGVLLMDGGLLTGGLAMNSFPPAFIAIILLFIHTLLWLSPRRQ